MQLVIDDFESVAPVVLFAPPMSDAEFTEFCQHYADYRIESTAEGEIIIMPPTYPKTGYQNVRIVSQLDGWSRRTKRGHTFDSSTGFHLPNGARRSADASWVSNERIRSVPAEEFDVYWRIAPDFIIELRSASDRLRTLQAKMLEWITNGVEVAWMIDPQERSVSIYTKSAEPVVLTNPERVHGSGPVDGFVLELAEIWSGI
jgi:Uma2 family endonuclease